jgi:hypothetical protein
VELRGEFGATLSDMIDSISARANFESKLVQVVSTTSERNLVLPLERAPIRFAVLMQSGRVSNTWKIEVNRLGDTYIFCRDNLQGQKVSLHCSGKQHIAFDPSIGQLPNSPKSRFMNQWQEPEFEDHAIPTFALLFPRWGVGLGRTGISTSEELWKKNELYVIGHKTEMTVVTFYIVDSNRNMVHHGPKSVIQLCKLPLRPGKTLHVFAERQAEGNLLELMRDTVFPHAGAVFAEGGAESGSYCMCATGVLGNGKTNYMVTFSVDYKAPR